MSFEIVYSNDIWSVLSSASREVKLDHPAPDFIHSHRDLSATGLIWNQASNNCATLPLFFQIMAQLLRASIHWIVYSTHMAIGVWWGNRRGDVRRPAHRRLRLNRSSSGSSD